MPILTSPLPDRRLLAAAVRRRSQPALWVMRSVGLFFALFGLLDFLLTGSCVTAVFEVAVGLLLALAVPAWLISRAAGRCWLVFGTPASYEIGDIGIQRTDLLTRYSYAWPAVSLVEDVPGQLIFSMGKRGFVAMPTSALIAGQLEHVLALAAGHGVQVHRRR